MAYLQVLHQQQLDDRKMLTQICTQIDEMYESLAAHEQKVSTVDQVKHDDLTEALTQFQQQLSEVRSDATAVVPTAAAALGA